MGTGETGVRWLRKSELEEIVTSGASSVSLRFAPEVVETIVDLSAGFPHFTHLLALKCAEEAIADSRRDVKMPHLKNALELAVQDAEGSLKRTYDDSTRSASDMYRTILIAAASLAEEFSAAQLRVAIERVSGDPISQGSLNNFFQRLVSRDGSTILRRTGQGHYRFEDPRMASYVGGQFP